MSIFASILGGPSVNPKAKLKPEEASLYAQRENLDPLTYDNQVTSTLAPYSGAAGAAAGSEASRLTAMGQDDGLYNQLRDSASADLAQGGDLAPEEVRAANQSALAGWSSRGMVRSPGAGFAAVLQRLQYANTRKQQRIQNATGVEGLRLQREQGAASALGTSGGIANALAQIGEGTREFELGRSDTQQFNDKNIAKDLKIGKQNAEAGQTAGIASGLGSIIGGALKFL